jgi:hypothetical protein
VEFYVLRVTVHASRDAPLLANLQDKRALLRAAVVDRPIGLTSRGSYWRIANVTPFQPEVIYFRLGRERRIDLPQTDETGDFVDFDAQYVPNTHVYLDLSNQICAIARQPKLAQTPAGFAGALGRILSASQTAQVNYITFDAAPIKEPSDFILRIRNAAVVRKLWVVTRRPNPFDAEEDFLKPTSRVLEGIGADKAKTQWEGEGLNVGAPETERIVRGAAATGGDAGATITEGAEGSRISLRMTGDAVKFALDINLDAPRQSMSEVLGRLRRVYERIWPGTR